MNAKGFRRGLRKYGRKITLRRLAGTAQAQVLRADGVLAAITVGAASNLSDSVQQTADQIMCTDLELRAQGFTDAPKHGDQCIYEDGRIYTVQGRAQIYILGPDTVYQFHTLGA